MKTSAQPRIFYGWVIVLVSFLTMLLVMGTRFSFGVFYSSMLAEMGWSRAATAGIFSVSMLVYAAVASGVGAAFDWWGPRRVFPVAAVLLGVGLSTVVGLFFGIYPARNAAMLDPIVAMRAES